jgi:hypothetical protein
MRKNRDRDQRELFLLDGQEPIFTVAEVDQLRDVAAQATAAGGEERAELVTSIRAERGETMTDALPDLVGIREIASRLGLRPQTVAVTLYRGKMPRPDWRISDVPIWRWSVIQEWAEKTGRTARARRRLH